MIKLSLKLMLCMTLFATIHEPLIAGKITVDPNANEAIAEIASPNADVRLTRKVTYEARHQPVSKILADLAEMSGVKLNAGKNLSDWPVRDRKMNIFVKDISLAALMNSIAHTMKFRWILNDEVKPATYRLVVDSKAAAAADAKKAKAEKKNEDILRRKRQELMDVIMKDGAMEASQVEATRAKDPVFYRNARTGAMRAGHAFFNEVPEAKRRFLEGQGFRIAADELSQHTRQLLYTAANEFSKFIQYGRWPAIGLVNEFTVNDKYDIACFRLDVNTFTPNLRWGVMSLGCLGYFHISRGEDDREIMSLRDKDAFWTRACSERETMTIDMQSREEADKILEPKYAILQQDRKKEEEALYPSEPLNEHPIFDELEKTIKLKIEIPKPEKNPVTALNRYIASFQEAIATETGLGVVSDSWVYVQGENLPDQDATLNELLEKFSTQYNYNWDMKSGIIEFRHRKWWKNRLNQIPDNWVAKWSENTRKNGILSLDDLAEIANNINYPQALESLRADMVLGQANEQGLYWRIVSTLDTNGNLTWLKLYHNLGPQLRTLLTSKGINGFMLTSGQWKLGQTLLDRIGSTRNDAHFKLELLPNATETIYQFREIDDTIGVDDRKWVVVLPKYVPPVKDDPKTQQTGSK